MNREWTQNDDANDEEEEDEEKPINDMSFFFSEIALESLNFFLRNPRSP